MIVSAGFFVLWVVFPLLLCAVFFLMLQVLQVDIKVYSAVFFVIMLQVLELYIRVYSSAFLLQGFTLCKDSENLTLKASQHIFMF